MFEPLERADYVGTVREGAYEGYVEDLGRLDGLPLPLPPNRGNRPVREAHI